VEFLQLISVNRKSVEMPSQSCCSVCSRKWVPELRSSALLVVAFGWGRKGSIQREVIEIPTNVPVFLLWQHRNRLHPDGAQLLLRDTIWRTWIQFSN
jgi:hypothetical protein